MLATHERLRKGVWQILPTGGLLARPEGDPVGSKQLMDALRETVPHVVELQRQVSAIH